MHVWAAVGSYRQVRFLRYTRGCHSSSCRVVSIIRTQQQIAQTAVRRFFGSAGRLYLVGVYGEVSGGGLPLTEVRTRI